MAALWRPIDKMTTPEAGSVNLAQIAESLTQALAVSDSSGAITLWNRAAESLFGSPPGQVLGRDLLEVLSITRRRDADEIRSALARGDVWSGEHDVALRDGSAVAIWCTLTPLAGETAGAIFALSQLRSRVRGIENRLVESEEKFRALFESAIDAVFVGKPGARILEANQAAIDLLGWPLEELKKVGLDAIIPSDSNQRSSAIQELETNGSHRGRHVLTRRDGRKIVGEIAINRFRASNGELRSVAVVRDITSQVDALRTLEAAEAKFRTLVEHALVGVYILKDGRYVYANPETQRILGYTEEQLLAMPSLLDTIVEEDRPMVLERLRERQMAPEGSLKHRFRALRGDGRVIELEVHGSIIDYEGGPATIGMAIDITEQQRASEELRRSESRYRTLVEEAEDIIFTCDLEGKITSLNRAFEKITGFESNDWIGRSYAEILDEASVPQANEHFGAVVTADVSLTRESRLKTASGRPVLVEGTARQLVIEGKLVGTIGIVRDITARRRMEVALERSSRFTALGRLAATIAHEVNNVLMGIQATVDLMERAADKPSFVRGIETLRTSILRGARMTQEVLRFTRMPEPELRSIAVVPLIEALRGELQGLVGEAITVRDDIRAPLSMSVMGDRSQLQQVFANLALNARDAMPRGGTFTIAVDSRPAKTPALRGSAVISVSDTGVGISSEMLPLIFEPLFTTKKSGGTGLGLAVVSQIIDKHGGTIQVQSEPGRGTTFEIVLPMSAVREETSPRVLRLSRPVERVLLVDDDPAISSGLAAVLELEGVATHVVELGAEVEAAVERFEPEVVVLDINLPDIPGTEVYRRLMTRWPSLPVIISSGHADEEIISNLTRDGRAAFLLKPYDLDTLLRTIAQVTASR